MTIDERLDAHIAELDSLFKDVLAAMEGQQKLLIILETRIEKLEAKHRWQGARGKPVTAQAARPKE